MISRIWFAWHRGMLRLSIGDILVSLTLTNDIQFLCDKYGVRGFATSDTFFNSQPLDIASFVGRWRLSRSDCLRLARRTVHRLGEKDLSRAVGRVPDRVTEPHLVGRRDVPRVFLEWDHSGGTVAIEIDAEQGRVTQIDLPHGQLWE